jgi:hypothetical protein
MTQQPWHDYAGESAETLFSLASSHRIDSLVVAFETALDQKAATLGLAALSQPEVDVLAVEGLEREVNNGGYRQFFMNSSNAYASQIVDALRRIDCPVTATITERAIAALPAGTSLTPEALDLALQQDDEGRDTELNECDGAYYESGEAIATKLFEYLLDHRNAIHFTA